MHGGTIYGFAVDINEHDDGWKITFIDFPELDVPPDDISGVWLNGVEAIREHFARLGKALPAMKPKK